VNGTLTADYNLFSNCMSPSYSDSSMPANDVHADAKLANPSAHALDFDEKAVWQRTLTPRSILSSYRGNYAPTVGSPAIDHGDPSLYGAGNDIGAIGAGTANSADQFGM
jgi:hypothetical protein